MAKHGEKTLHRYSKDFMDANPSPLLDARKHELIGIVQNLLTDRLGVHIAQRVARQLQKLPLVSTTDHHALIQHPFFLNANIISAVPYLEYADPDVRYLVVFSFAGISMNNASGFPRGLLFHGGLNGSGNVIRLPLFPDRTKMSTVYSMRAFTREDIDRMEKELMRRERMGEISPERGKRVRELISSCIATSEVLEEKDFQSQITQMNFHLWPKLFHAPGHDPHSLLSSFLSQKVPSLVYLEIETLVKELLLREHFHRKDSLLHRLIFDPAMRPLVLRHFDGLPGAFSQSGQSGTYLFWALDPQGHRVRLMVEGNTLRSFDGAYCFDLTPEAIAEALERKQIFPGMLLSYLTISLYYGMKCLGGFCQVHDLTMVKQAWMKLLSEIGERDEADAVIPVQTKELGGDGLTVAYFETIQKTLVPAMGMDMVLDETDTTFEKYVDLAKKVTLSEAMQPLLPEIYSVLYTAQERDPALSLLKPEDILHATGLEEKFFEGGATKELTMLHA
jgi:hypothetical protein